MGRELPGGKRAYWWEESSPVERELPSGLWEESFPVRRDLPSGKRASGWEESFPMERGLTGGKRALYACFDYLINTPS